MTVNGPYVQVAAICEQVIEDKQGKMSLVGLYDRVIVQTRVEGDVPVEMPPQRVPMKIVVALKSGEALGRHHLDTRLLQPSGHYSVSFTPPSLPILFEQEERGVNVVIDTQVPLEQEGLHWFEIYLDDEQLLTKIPLRAVFQPLKFG